MTKTLGRLLPHLLTIIFIAICSLTANAQDPVTWTITATKKTGNTYEVVIAAMLSRPWKIYSQNSSKGGPLPTTITFKSNPKVVINGKPKEVGKLIKEYDANFKTDVLYYLNSVDFITTVKGSNTRLLGTVAYMLCDNTRCLPPVKKPISVQLE